jgi:hypothetical protein
MRKKIYLNLAEKCDKMSCAILKMKIKKEEKNDIKK